METISENACFGGVQGVYRHASGACSCDMTFGLFLPAEAADGPVPETMNVFLTTLGNAATPGALFAIGASLATKTADRPHVALWLSFCKLVLHPLGVAFCALWIIPLDPYPAAVMIATASLPVAGNVYILAHHYGVASHRVSTSILFSTIFAVISVSLVLAWVQQLYGG